MMNCPLCNSTSFPFHKGSLGEYERCDTCKGIFLLPQYHLSKDEEKKRYEKHNNNVEDPRYQKFVQPLVDAIMNNCSKEHQGLDYGCGEGPVVSYLLEKEGYDIDLYDPLFYDEKTVFRRDYDYIILSEVMEHFNSPKKEFETLFPMLKPKGKIFCLTELYHENIDFSKWHYKNDETHVFFYDIKTISYISKKFKRPNFEINGRLTIL